MVAPGLRSKYLFQKVLFQPNKLKKRNLNAPKMKGDQAAFLISDICTDFCFFSLRIPILSNSQMA